MSWHLTSWHLMSWHLTSWQMMPLHMTSWHMMSLHTMSWHMIYDLSWIWEGNYLWLELKTWGSQNCSALQSQDSRIVWQSNCRVACKFLVIFMFGVVFVFVVYSIFGIHLISFVIFNFHFSLFYVSLIFLGPSSFLGWLHFWVILFLDGVFIFGLAFFVAVQDLQWPYQLSPIGLFHGPHDGTPNLLQLFGLHKQTPLL